MLTVKTRKQGNAVTVTVPKALGIEPGQEYVVIKGENGAFTYVPKLEDIFEKAEREDLDLRPSDILPDDEPTGRESL